MTTKREQWVWDTMQMINELTPNIKDKAFDPGWFKLREHFEATAAELTALQKEVEGVRNNAPKCGACAEALFCGSTMHQHDTGCVYTERDSLRKQNAELVEALREISSAPVSEVSWLEQCERRMKIAEQALATQPEKSDG